jgi:hypothetical protein
MAEQRIPQNIYIWDHFSMLQYDPSPCGGEGSFLNVEI